MPTLAPAATRVPTGTLARTGSYVVRSPPASRTTTTGVPATAPAYATVPGAAARTGAPGPALRSTPRWPAAQGAAGGSNPRSTSGRPRKPVPVTGQHRAPAHPTPDGGSPPAVPVPPAAAATGPAATSTAASAHSSRRTCSTQRARSARSALCGRGLVTHSVIAIMPSRWRTPPPPR